MSARVTAIGIRTFVPAPAPARGAPIDGVALDLLAGDWTLARARFAARRWTRVFMPMCQLVAARALGPTRFCMELPMADEADDANAASGVRLGYAEDGRLAIELLDEDEAVIAVAWLTAELFADFIGQGCDLLEIMAKGGLATVECGGSA